MQSRAYSTIEIKSINDGERILDGIASTPTPDRLSDIVDPMGATFKTPLPFLWQHNHDQPIGHVTAAKASKTGISFRAQLAMTEEPGALKDLLDLAWQSIKLKLVAFVSIGFNPLKYAFMDNGGIEFQEWEWLELSAVTIPAQPDAVITSVKQMDLAKQFDKIYREVAGVPEPEFPEPPEPVATDNKVRVVKLSDTPLVRAKPFVINEIIRSKR